MLLLCIDALLLLFISTGCGIIMLRCLEKFFRIPVQTDLLGIFLIGLACSTIYFNILSFWFPINYWTLVPMAGLIVFLLLFNKVGYRPIMLSIRSQWDSLFSPAGKLSVLLLLIVFICYWALPNLNSDSKEYHYLSILWYEKYKVIPGLANVHGRFAFNPASFIIQSAYSFTDPVGQSIYPLNGLVTLLFLLWTLARMLDNKHSFVGLAYLALFTLICRALFINVSSPSSDTLVFICIAWSLMSLFDNKAGTLSLSSTLIPLIIILFAPIAKLSAYPLLLILPPLFYLLPKTVPKVPLFAKLLAIALLIYLPWLGRNYILSGYLVYPLPYLDLFHPDWKAPRDILLVDYYYIKYGVNHFIPDRTDIARLQSQSFLHWFISWVKSQLSVGNLSILFLALFSPIAWVGLYLWRKRKDPLPFLCWLVSYIGVWIWMISSPEYRFGMVFLSLSIFFPLFLLTKNISFTGPAILKTLLTLLFILSITNYLFEARYEHHRYINKQHITQTDSWLLPLKDLAYTTQDNRPGFRYKVLNTGVKLYIADSAHLCINTDQPCMVWEYGEIEMRGSRMDQGFRTTKNEVWEHFPFFK